MEYIGIEEVMDLNDNDEVLVNRLRINLELVKINLQKETKKNKYKQIILYKAIRNMLEQEQISKKTSFGALMKVEDIKIIFNNRHEFPVNTFARAQKKNSLSEIKKNNGIKL